MHSAPLTTSPRTVRQIFTDGHSIANYAFPGVLYRHGIGRPMDQRVLIGCPLGESLQRSTNFTRSAQGTYSRPPRWMFLGLVTPSRLTPTAPL